MPKMLEAIKSRLDILSASKKLPENLDKAKLEGAKGGYEAAAKMWDDAKAAFAGGNLADAMAKGEDREGKGRGSDDGPRHAGSRGGSARARARTCGSTCTSAQRLRQDNEKVTVAQ